MHAPAAIDSLEASLRAAFRAAMDYALVAADLAVHFLRFAVIWHLVGKFEEEFLCIASV
ncbi:hypothetical protein C1H46_005039 [Malus baccata]|uniref:Uncharacterized protein n=1 Tax=Malus baccata TaxID=106549 RepID=A0A540NEE5_MALBA|nr:hypothetical protein C1H46_005039 [Malus baccata]